MKNTSPSIDRLLRSAATLPAEPGAKMPFGFDTRVVAQWRAALSNDPAGIASLLRRVTLVAIALIVLAGAGAYRELQGDDPGDEYAIPDSATGLVFDQ